MAIDWDEVFRENTTIQGWVERYSRRAVEEEIRHITLQVERKVGIEYLRLLIELRFSDVPEWASEKIEAAPIGQLRPWFRRAVVATDVTEIFA